MLARTILLQQLLLRRRLWNARYTGARSSGLFISPESRFVVNATVVYYSSRSGKSAVNVIPLLAGQRCLCRRQFC